MRKALKTAFFVLLNTIFTCPKNRIITQIIKSWAKSWAKNLIKRKKISAFLRFDYPSIALNECKR